MADTFCPTHGDIADEHIALGGVCGIIHEHGTECEAHLLPDRATWLAQLRDGRCPCWTGAGAHDGHCCHVGGPLCDDHDAQAIADLVDDPKDVIARLNHVTAALYGAAAKEMRRG